MWLLFLACTTSEPDTQGVSDTPVDTGQPWAWDDSKTIRENCFPTVQDQGQRLPDYDALDPVISPSCSGTNHQDITGVQKVVFLGDSITAGTPPTPEDEFYRNQVVAELEQQFGTLETDDCSYWGARTDDLVGQISRCFPQPQDKTTLVVMTMGGNDVYEYADALTYDGATVAQLAMEAYEDAQLLRDALLWFRDNQAVMFPAGVYVVFADIYEYTDGTGDMYSCPAAEILELGGDVPELRDLYISMNESYMAAAIETQTDMIFMQEHFCGHGFHYDDPDTECYQPDAEIWFDGTCLHPNPTGHGEIADMFLDVILDRPHE